ncbi:uncharacterized protein LOC119741499 [Patiria miniata]|uniref:C2H2-type domain-containing protein n=1 Tax=Patiria miniata TaxID=46514 RepID=A0A914BAI2_PATMI|nr:uncharacterized protein LOC119741499 [Patiria miniata]
MASSSASRNRRIKIQSVLDDNPILAAASQRAALCPQEVFKEQCWFEQTVTSPKDVIKPQLDQSLLRQYQEAIWHNDPSESLPQFGMTVDEMSCLCNNAELLSAHVIWLMELLNRIQKKAVCLYLQGSPAGSLIPHLQRKGWLLQSVRRLVVVASVAKDSENNVCLSNESGSHWVLLVVELQGKKVYYCDSLAWASPPIPSLLKTLQEYCNFFDYQVTPDSIILCHEPTPQGQGQHICSSNCMNYPLLPQDSHASGVFALISAVVSTYKSACYLKQTTDQEAYLREVLICWFMAGTIDLQNIQTKTGSSHQTPSDGTSQKPSKSLRSNSRKELGGKKEGSADDVEKKNENGRLECNVCHSMYGSRAALFKHKRSKHPDHEYRQAPDRSLVYCTECGIRCYKVARLVEHYQTQHGKQYSIQKKTFASEAEFQTWKKWVEKKSNAKFVQKHGRRSTPWTLVRTFHCNRSGFFVSKGQGKRSLKSKGSVKINAACPAFIKATEDCVMHSVEAEFCLDHIHECDVRYLRLSSDSRKMIAEKLLLGISVDAIVDEVRHSANTKDRDYHISRRDVLNVKLSLNLDIDSKAESAYQAEMESTKKEALQTVEEITSLIQTSSSVDILKNVQKHLKCVVKAGKGVLAVSDDHNYH